MNPRPAILLSVLFAILLPIYLFVDRREVKPTALQQEQQSLFKLSNVDAISMTRGSESLRYQKTPDGKLFQLIQPQGKFVPQDLMQAMASLLINAKQVEVVATDTNDLKQFGLDKPDSEMTIEAAGHQPIKIDFGFENPTKTAIYAKIEGIPKVFLLGRNLEYYQSLMFQWVEGKQGKNA